MTPTLPLDDYILIRRADLEELRARAEAPPRPPDAAPLLTPAEAARQLGVSKSLVHNLVARGELKAVRFGRVVRIRPADLANLITERRRDARRT